MAMLRMICMPMVMKKAPEAIGLLIIIAMGLVALIRSAFNFENCSQIDGLNEFTVSFACVTIILGFVKAYMAYETRTKEIDQPTLRTRLVFAFLGLVCVGLAGWGTPLVFGDHPVYTDCNVLIRIAKGQCIMTWIIFGMTLLRKAKEHGLICKDDDEDNEDEKGEDDQQEDTDSEEEKQQDDIENQKAVPAVASVDDSNNDTVNQAKTAVQYVNEESLLVKKQKGSDNVGQKRPASKKGKK